MELQEAGKALKTLVQALWERNQHCFLPMHAVKFLNLPAVVVSDAAWFEERVGRLELTAAQEDMSQSPYPVAMMGAYRHV